MDIRKKKDVLSNSSADTIAMVLKGPTVAVSIGRRVSVEIAVIYA